MRIYLAARYDRRVEMNDYAEALHTNGHIVDCRWLNGSHQLHDKADEIEAVKGDMPIAARPFAQDDVEDIKNSDVMIFFSERPGSISNRGGRHVEFGIALALGKRIMVVGSRENVFHCLLVIEHYQSFSECMEALNLAQPEEPKGLPIHPGLC